MEIAIISNFWTAVVSCVILVATALLLEDHEHVGKILVMQGLAFGFRLGDQTMKSYQVGKADPTNLKV